MPVYVDKSKNQYGRMIMCHMIADTADELHDMAAMIGIKRKWFQEKASFPHYDICQSKKVLAIQCGAIECERNDFVGHMRRIRQLLSAPGA